MRERLAAAWAHLAGRPCAELVEAAGRAIAAENELARQLGTVTVERDYWKEECAGRADRMAEVKEARRALALTQNELAEARDHIRVLQRDVSDQVETISGQARRIADLNRVIEGLLRR